jgi:small subunit ribosomal protein S6
MKYELMIILKSLLPEDIRNGVLKRVENLVTSQNGAINKLDTWGKRHLAYTINKHEEGYYVVYDITLPNSSTTNGIKEELNLISDILRFILIKKD